MSAVGSVWFSDASLALLVSFAVAFVLADPAKQFVWHSTTEALFSGVVTLLVNGEGIELAPTRRNGATIGISRSLRRGKGWVWHGQCSKSDVDYRSPSRNNVPISSATLTELRST